MLADGSEYTGAYADGLDLAALRRFHRPRLQALADAGADVLACETLPAALEVEALLLELEELDVPAWVSLTTVVDADGTVRTRRGEGAEEVFAMVGDARPSSPPASTACAPRTSAPPARGGCDRPAGRRLPEQRRAVGRGAPRVDRQRHLAVGRAETWVDGGARLVGGCCRVGPELLASLAAGLARA